MKIRPLLIALAATTLLLLTGCKTTEKNYREAYDLVMAKKQADKESMDDVEGIIANTSNTFTTGRPGLLKVGDDTLHYRVEYVRMTPPPTSKKATKEEEAAKMHAPMERFNIVAGSFRQLFNARTLEDRLRFLGYDTFIVHNNTPTYYVIAGTYTMAVDALKALNEIEHDKRLTLLQPCPWVLQPAHLTR